MTEETGNPRAIVLGLERLVLDCLAKDPSLRPETAQVLSARLAACDDVERWNPEDARTWWQKRKTA